MVTFCISEQGKNRLSLRRQIVHHAVSHSYLYNNVLFSGVFRTSDLRAFFL